MRVAIYGGSFNPPHIGHAMVAAWLGWTDQVDAVWLMPTYRHAFGKSLLPFERRVALCQALAAEVGPHVRVCKLERELPEPSYTVDTLAALRRRHPEHRFRLVVGADILPDTPKWKDWPTIERLHTPIVVGRGGYPPIEGRPTFPEVSSTHIRARHDRGESVRDLVPKSVLELLEGVRFSA